MATAELIRGGASGPASPSVDLATQLSAGYRRPFRAASALLAALMVLLLYAAFAHGDVGLPTEARVQVAIAALAGVAAAGWLWNGSLRASAPPLALAGVALLAAFASWTGLTVLWSVTPSETWLELNRVLAYLLVLVLAIAIGASHPRSVELTAKWFLAVALTVTSYALGQKLVPGLHVDGVFDLNQTSVAPRLRAPLDYWNALALFIAFAVPIALARAAEDSRTDRSRLGALLATALMLLTIGFTYSRGGLIALVLALAVAIVLGGAWQRLLMLFGLAAIASLPALIFGLTDHALSVGGVSLPQREASGAELTLLLIASLVLLWVAGRKLIGLEQRQPPSARHERRATRSLAVLAVTALLGGLLALALSPRGIDGSLSHAWKSATSKSGAGLYDPNRLVSVDSSNRWVWWKEAVGAFSDRPIAGWGAGSFPVLHLLYRRDTLPVQQPHSVPLQFLAETGLVGAVLGLGAYGLLLAAGVGRVRRLVPGPERRLAAALLAGGVAYGIHALYDWDWNFASVTLPALVFLGMLAGARPVRAAPPPPAPESAPSSRPLPQAVVSLPGPGAGARALSLGAVALVLSLITLSAVLPSASSSEARSALVAASSPSQTKLRSALASAELATRLDPLSDAGLKAASAIALHRGRPGAARDYLLAAVKRVPSDAQAWAQLADVELTLNDARGLVRAANRALALDPLGARAGALVAAAEEFATSPSSSATATATPLPSG